MRTILKVLTPIVLLTTVLVGLSRSMSSGHWERYQLNHKLFLPTHLVFADSNVGYLFGCDTNLNRTDLGGIQSNAYYLYRTIDGGRTWTQINLDRFRFQAVDYAWDASKLSEEGRLIRVVSPSTVYIAYNSDTSDGNYLRRGFLVSRDTGRTWTILYGSPVESAAPDSILTLFDESNALSFNGSNLMHSVNSCQNFYFVTPDTTLKHLITGEHRVFGHSDLQHLLFLVARPSANLQGDSGMYSVISSDGGKHWSTGGFPEFPERSSGSAIPLLQCIANSPYVFALTRRTLAEGSSRETTKPWGQDDTKMISNILVGLPQDSISYFRSSNHGYTWTPQRAYGAGRFGFEAVGPDNIWMTVTPRGGVRRSPSIYRAGFEEDNFQKDQLPPPASVIVHSTDGGLTWDEDRSTLLIGEAAVDGQIITSVDSNHLWMAAVYGGYTYIYRYVATSNSAAVEYGHGANGFRSEYLMDFYPNPADESITVALKQKLPIVSCSIYDVFGRKVRVPVQNRDESTINANTHDLTNGFYFVVITSGAERLSKPIVVQHH